MVHFLSGSREHVGWMGYEHVPHGTKPTQTGSLDLLQDGVLGNLPMCP
jgi:hypothetical protein